MERHAKSLKSPLKTCSFAPRISRIYPSAKGDEDLIPWVGIIGVAFCQKILRFTICAVFFSIGIWKSLVILGYLLPAEIHSCPKGKYIFFGRGIHGPRKIHLQQSHLQQPLLRQGVRGKFLGQNPLVERWFPNNVELSRWESSCHPVVHHYPESPGSRDDVWNHLENGPQHKSKGYLSLFQAWFVGRRVKNCPITIKQNQGRQSMDLWQLVLPFHNISGTLCFWPEFERNLSEFLDDGVVINPAGDHFHQLKARMQSLQISRGSPRSPWNFAKFLRNRWKNKTKLSSPKGKEKPNSRENVTGATEQLITRAKHV